MAVLASCNMIGSNDDAAMEVAVCWADAYFNCDYAEAQKLSTAESEQWLRFAASNTSERDLQLLHERPAIVESHQYYTVANDTMCVVELQVNNCLAPTAPGEDARQEEASGTYLLTVVKRNGNWKVRMEGLPQSERQSRD